MTDILQFGWVEFALTLFFLGLCGVVYLISQHLAERRADATFQHLVLPGFSAGFSDRGGDREPINPTTPTLSPQPSLELPALPPAQPPEKIRVPDAVLTLKYRGTAYLVPRYHAPDASEHS